MAYWQTNEIVALIQAEIDNPESPVPSNVEVIVCDQPSEMCSEQIVVRIEDCRLYITAFDSECSFDEVTSPSDCHLPTVELTDGTDSSGGLHSMNRDVCITYGVLHAILSLRGFYVATSMTLYF